MSKKATPEEEVEIINQLLPIDALSPHPRNYQVHPEPQLGQLRSSLARFGQVRSIVVQEGAPGKFLIVAGHGIVEAARQHGLTAMRADVIPATWTPTQVEGYLLADNLTARQSIPDEDLLAQLLQEQLDAGVDLVSLGSNEAELNDLLAKLTPPTLDDLAEQYGDEPEEDAFWPVIRLKVSPDTKGLYESLMEQAPGTTEAVKFEQILQAVDTATLESGEMATLGDDEP